MSDVLFFFNDLWLEHRVCRWHHVVSEHYALAALMPSTWAHPAEESSWHVLVHEGRGVAIGGLQPVTGWLGPTYVVTELRGRGLQRLLLKLRLARARYLGLKALRTAIAPNNVASLNNALGAGLKITGWSDEHQHLELEMHLVA